MIFNLAIFTEKKEEKKNARGEGGGEGHIRDEPSTPGGPKRIKNKGPRLHLRPITFPTPSNCSRRGVVD
jgi:hypothetical protein